MPEVATSVIAALVTFSIFYIDNRISFIEGGLLLVYYALYVAYVVLQVAQSYILSMVTFFAGFLIPLTFIALVVMAIKSWLRSLK